MVEVRAVRRGDRRAARHRGSTLDVAPRSSRSIPRHRHRLRSSSAGTGPRPPTSRKNAPARQRADRLRHLRAARHGRRGVAAAPPGRPAYGGGPAGVSAERPRVKSPLVGSWPAARRGPDTLRARPGGLIIGTTSNGPRRRPRYRSRSRARDRDRDRDRDRRACRRRTGLRSVTGSPARRAQGDRPDTAPQPHRRSRRPPPGSMWTPPSWSSCAGRWRPRTGARRACWPSWRASRCGPAAFRAQRPDRHRARGDRPAGRREPRIATQTARAAGACRVPGRAAQRARADTAIRAAPSDTGGAARADAGSFTLNNYGGFGVDGSAAIIKHPEVAILGVGDHQRRGRGRRGGGPYVGQLSLVFDHRLPTARPAGGFLRHVADASSARSAPLWRAEPAVARRRLQSLTDCKDIVD